MSQPDASISTCVLPSRQQEAQLSYCRDSARRRSLRRSRSLKVTDLGTNRKPVCDLLLVMIIIIISY